MHKKFFLMAAFVFMAVSSAQNVNAEPAPTPLIQLSSLCSPMVPLKIYDTSTACTTECAKGRKAWKCVGITPNIENSPLVCCALFK